MTEGSGPAAPVHVLRATLLDVRPAVWRRLEVPSAITLGHLHLVLQAAFDWSGDHLHDFDVRGTRYTRMHPGPFRPPLFGDPLGTRTSRCWVVSGVVEALLDGPVVRLTSLGSYGAGSDAGRPRLAGSGSRCLPHADSGELLDRLAAYSPSDAAEQVEGWLAARGEDWAQAVEQVMWSAAARGEVGPARRALLPMVLGAAGSRVVPVMDAGV